jgi:hypothetical protein
VSSATDSTAYTSIEATHTGSHVVARVNLGGGIVRTAPLAFDYDNDHVSRINALLELRQIVDDEHVSRINALLELRQIVDDEHRAARTAIHEEIARLHRESELHV